MRTPHQLEAKLVAAPLCRGEHTATERRGYSGILL